MSRNPIKFVIDRIEDNSREYKKMIDGLMDHVARRGADIVCADAKQLVPVLTGQLKGQIEVKRGKFEKMDFNIEAQGPGNYSRYYAIFVELGSTIHPYGNPNATKHLPAQPYLRPALKKNRKKITQMAQGVLG